MLRCDQIAQVAGFRFHQRSFRGDRNRLGHLAELEAKINGQPIRHVQLQARPHGFLEALRGYVNLIHPNRERLDQETPVGLRRGRALGAGAEVPDDDGSIRDNRAGRVDDRPGDRARDLRCECRCRYQQEEQCVSCCANRHVSPFRIR